MGEDPQRSQEGRGKACAAACLGVSWSCALHVALFASTVPPCGTAGPNPSLLVQEQEAALASFLHSSILAHSSFSRSMAVLLANKLASQTLPGTQLMRLITEAYEAEPVRCA